MSSSGYTAITFVANEQPTTAKWNLIGSNDASFNNGNGFEDGIIVNRHIGAGELRTSKLKNLVMFSAWRNAALNITTSTAAIPFDSEDYDIGSNFSTANGKFTAPVNGYYEFKAALLAAYSTNDHVYGGVLKNDAEYKRFFENTKPGATNMTDGMTAEMYMAAGDTAAFYCSANTTCAVLVANSGKYCWFTGKLVAIA